MKAIGITCGIGSMLVPAKQLGFEVVGNIEWRRYYHVKDSQGRNTFTENFPGAIFANKIEDLTEEEIERMTGCDIAFGHPECGNFSQMTGTAQYKRTIQEFNNDPGDIPIFVKLIKRLRPRFFVQDNLPKSLIGYPIEDWSRELPEYDLFPEWISNWAYGNIQKYRKRFFMIGALKSEGFSFTPGEIDTPKKLIDILKNLPEQNNEPHSLEGKTSKGRGHYGDDHMSWEQYHDYMSKQDDGHTVTYRSSDGTWKKHVGLRKAFREGYCPVITGGVPVCNPLTNLPFTVRERCRIQGLPDDFIIYGTKLNPDGTFNHNRNAAINKQVGKCMPVQFCRFITEQILAHIQGRPWEPKMKPDRTLARSDLIDQAKKYLCGEHGYTSQGKVCRDCWMIGGCEHKQMSIKDLK